MERPEPGGPHAIPRRHAPIEQLVRQGSFRGFPALSQKNSPFKRQLSLRLNDLPSTLQRKTADFEAKNAGELRAGELRSNGGGRELLTFISADAPGILSLACVLLLLTFVLGLNRVVPGDLTYA